MVNAPMEEAQGQPLTDKKLYVSAPGGAYIESVTNTNPTDENFQVFEEGPTVSRSTMTNRRKHLNIQFVCTACEFQWCTAVTQHSCR